MAFQKGNKLWQLATKPGIPKKYTPDKLWKKAIDYFEWIENNPLLEAVPMQRGIDTYEKDDNGNPIKLYQMPMPKMHVMTQAGLCLFLGITQQTYIEYRKKDEFTEVCARIDAIIYEHKMSGAAAGLLNPAIIARDLGLVDKQHNQIGIDDEMKEYLKPFKEKKADE